MKFIVEIEFPDGVFDHARLSQEIIKSIEDSTMVDASVTPYDEKYNFFLNENQMRLLYFQISAEIEKTKYNRALGYEVNWNSIDTLRNIKINIQKKFEEIFNYEIE